MNSKKSKKLLAKARSSKKVKTGMMTGDERYLVLKKEDRAKKKKQTVKPKLSKRQNRLWSDDLNTIQLRGRARAKERQQATKKKAHKF